MKTAFLLLVVLLLGFSQAKAQSLRGKVIYVSQLQDVKFKFKSTVENYSFVNKPQSAFFKIKSSGRSLQISGLAANFKPANLVITEGDNTHLFILTYKNNLDATETAYDFSSKEKLQDEVVKLSTPPQRTAAKNDIVKYTAAEPEKTPVVQTVNIPNEKTEPKLNTTPVNDSRTQKVQVVNSTSLNTSSSTPAKSDPAKEMIDARIKDESDSIRYELYIHLGDSSAWIAKDYNEALTWYESAQRLNPQATYPKKQIKVVQQLKSERDASIAVKQRTASFSRAMEYYRKADTLRVERKFEESYKGYIKFLNEIDTSNLAAYRSSEMHYINQAKDYVVRLQPYLPKPKVESVVQPVAEKKKGKRKKE